MTTGRPMLLLLLAALALLPASAAASAAAPPAASGRSLQKEKGEAQPSAWFDEMDLFVPQFDEDGQGGDEDRDISRPQSAPTPRPPISAAAAGPAECGLQWSRSVGCGAKATRDYVVAECCEGFRCEDEWCVEADGSYLVMTGEPTAGPTRKPTLGPTNPPQPLRPPYENLSLPLSPLVVTLAFPRQFAAGVSGVDEQMVRYVTEQFLFSRLVPMIGPDLAEGISLSGVRLFVDDIELENLDQTARADVAGNKNRVTRNRTRRGLGGPTEANGRALQQQQQQQQGDEAAEAVGGGNRPRAIIELSGYARFRVDAGYLLEDDSDPAAVAVLGSATATAPAPPSTTLANPTLLPSPAQLVLAQTTIFAANTGAEADLEDLLRLTGESSQDILGNLKNAAVEHPAYVAPQGVEPYAGPVGDVPEPTAGTTQAGLGADEGKGSGTAAAGSDPSPQFRTAVIVIVTILVTVVAVAVYLIDRSRRIRKSAEMVDRARREREAMGQPGRTLPPGSEGLGDVSVDLSPLPIVSPAGGSPAAGHHSSVSPPRRGRVVGGSSSPKKKKKKSVGWFRSKSEDKNGADQARPGHERQTSNSRFSDLVSLGSFRGAAFARSRSVRSQGSQSWGEAEADLDEMDDYSNDAGSSVGDVGLGGNASGPRFVGDDRTLEDSVGGGSYGVSAGMSAGYGVGRTETGLSLSKYTKLGGGQKSADDREFGADAKILSEAGDVVHTDSDLAFQQAFNRDPSDLTTASQRGPGRIERRKSSLANITEENHAQAGSFSTEAPPEPKPKDSPSKIFKKKPLAYRGLYGKKKAGSEPMEDRRTMDQRAAANSRTASTVYVNTDVVGGAKPLVSPANTASTRSGSSSDSEAQKKRQEAKRRMEQQMQYSPARGPKPTSSGANIPPSMLAQEPTSAAANEDGTEVLSNLNHLSSYLKGES